MRLLPLSALVIALSIAAPATSAFAAPRAAHREVPTATPKGSDTAPAPVSDADRYAAREAADTSVAEFEGGDNVNIAIGGSTLGILVLVLLLVIIF
jgi:hypothetical protein